jgi:hypothetical protein
VAFKLREPNITLVAQPAVEALNQPVQDYLKAVKFKAPRGASEGARFIDLAKKLRSSLLQNPGHPAKNPAELDM